MIIGCCLLLLLLLLLSLFYFGNLSFRQTTGILIGSDPASVVVNIFLHFENKCLLDIKKRNLRKARLFNNTFRYIDNLCTINDHLKFDNSKRKTSEASFLDLSIIIEIKK